jgi:transcriptional regulator with XRE-family HTH domain
MSQIASLLNTLKRELKAQGITYAEAAARLELSESSIKRLFSESRLSLHRLEQLCGLVGLEISDLVLRMTEARRRLDRLTEEQEREVAGDPRLLLVAICVLRW